LIRYDLIARSPRAQLEGKNVMRNINWTQLANPTRSCGATRCRRL
jgi:hypothetical protein